MVLTGYSHQISINLSPPQIIAPEYANSGDPALLAGHCLEAVDAQFAERVREGDLLVVAGSIAGGEGMEPAVLALQAAGVAAVICAAAAADMVALAESYGLPVLVSPQAAAAIATGALVRLDLQSGNIEDRTHQQRWEGVVVPATTLDAARRAQLLVRMRRVTDEEGYAE